MTRAIDALQWAQREPSAAMLNNLESTAVGDGRKTSSTRCPYEAMHQSAIIRTKQARDKSFNCILFTIFLLFFCAAADAVFCFVIVLSIGIVNYDTLTQRSVTTMQ